MNQLHEKFMRQRYNLFVNGMDDKHGDLTVELGGRADEFMQSTRRSETMFPEYL